MKAQDLKKQLLNVVGPVDFPKRLWNFCKNLPMPKPMRPSADIFSRCKTKQKTTAPIPTA